MIRRIARRCTREARLAKRRHELRLGRAERTDGLSKQALAEEELSFFHRDGQTLSGRWPWPDWLALPDEPWARSLRELYTLPATFPGSVSPEMGCLVQALVRNIRPRIAVEVGVYCSVSTHWIASALQPDCHLISFDDFVGLTRHVNTAGAEKLETNRKEWVEERLAAAGLLERIRLIEGKSASNIVLHGGELLDRGGVDFAFVDGDHTDAGVLDDLLAIEPVLNTGGYLVLHDVFITQSGHEGPRLVLGMINERLRGAYEQCSLLTSPRNYGIAVVRRIG